MTCLDASPESADFNLDRECDQQFLYQFKINDKGLKELLSEPPRKLKKRKMTISFQDGFKDGEIDVGEPGKTFGIKVTDIFAKGKRKVVDAIAKEHKETFDNIGEVGGNITTQFNIKSTIGKMGAINKAEDKKVNRSTYVDQVTALKKPGVKGRKAKATPSLREHRVKQSQDGVKKHGDAPMQSYNQRTTTSTQSIRTAEQLRQTIREYEKLKKEAMASWDRMQSLPELAQIEELEAKLQQACKDKRSEQVDKLQKEVRQVFKIHEEKNQPDKMKTDYNLKYTELRGLKEKIATFQNKKMKKNK